MVNDTHPLFKESEGFKPFVYPWAYDAYLRQFQIRWAPEEVPLANDLEDFNQKLLPTEQEFVRQILRYFTQGDMTVAAGYVDKYLPLFKANEVRMMLLEFAAMEANHIRSYALLLDTLGMPESEYQAFHQYDEMQAKHDYMMQSRYYGKAGGMTPVETLLLDLACFSLFGEGLQLYSSFVMLLNFSRQKLLKGMGSINQWSVRDEVLHVESMTRLFVTVAKDHPEAWNDKVKQAVSNVCQQIVLMEDAFIDLAYKAGTARNLEAADVKAYVRYIANCRLNSVGLDPLYPSHPPDVIPWMAEYLELDGHTNFFEEAVTNYSQCSLTGTWPSPTESRLFDARTILSATL